MTAETLEVSLQPDESIQLLGEAAAELERLQMQLEFQKKRADALDEKLRNSDSAEIRKERDGLKTDLAAITDLVGVPDTDAVVEALKETRRYLNCDSAKQNIEEAALEISSRADKVEDLESQLAEAKGHEADLVDRAVAVIESHLPDKSPYELKIIKEALLDALF